MSLRISKVNELIKQQISEIISREVDFKPGIFLTISKVDTTKDLRYTRVFVSIFPERESEYAAKTLQNELSGIQKILNKKLHMKILPKIKFIPDSTEARADEIEKILKNI